MRILDGWLVVYKKYIRKMDIGEDEEQTGQQSNES